jgi:hypothetical protein
MRSCSQMLVPRQSSQAPLAVIPADAGAPHGGYARRCWHPRSPFTGAWSSMLLADAPLAVMLADAGAPAVLACFPHGYFWQMLAPPQSLQVPCCFPCPHLPRSPHLRHCPSPSNRLGRFATRTVTTRTGDPQRGAGHPVDARVPLGSKLL